MTPAQLAESVGCPSLELAARWLDPLEAAMAEYGIDTPTRQAAFLAQIGHESGGLKYTAELWGPTPAQASYEGRTGLGNFEPGDGFRYRGRGLLQITGRGNYAQVGKALGLDLLGHPDVLSEPLPAARSAAWFWQHHGLNLWADRGDFQTLTRKINGGLTGYADRLTRWADAKEALAC